MPGNKLQLNGPGRGRHVARGPAGLHVAKKTMGIEEDARAQKLARQGGPKANLARAFIISALPGILSHSSQDRNAILRKAGGAVNIEQSKEQ